MRGNYLIHPAFHQNNFLKNPQITSIFIVKPNFMYTELINNQSDFQNWYQNTIENSILIFEFGEPEPPTEYPCIIIYDYTDPSTTTQSEEEEFDELLEQGYCSDEIEKFIYHYVYQSDFRRQP
jgi:hypothetical protein